jgi:hypothetical protein
VARSVGKTVISLILFRRRYATPASSIFGNCDHSIRASSKHITFVRPTVPNSAGDADRHGLLKVVLFEASEARLVGTKFPFLLRLINMPPQIP